MNNNYSDDSSFFKKKRRGNILVSFFFIFIISSLGVFLFSPKIFEGEKIIIIPEGYSLIQTGKLLEKEGLIHSLFVFRMLGKGMHTSVKAGVYLFEKPEMPTKILKSLNDANYGDIYETLTIPEGSTRKEIANIFSKAKFEYFNKEKFLKQSKGKEGYLFPDSYYFLPNVTIEKIIATLNKNFEKRTHKLKETLNPNISFSDIIIMASIIEKEATRNKEEQRIVSGILWKRIKKGIPLQVDAPFVYMRNKGSSELSTSDLRLDGPYNTYTRKGLPPTPIGNPGLATISAAQNPKESLYFFYLHDTNGNIHYGISHDDHIKNKRDYLK